MVLKERIHQLSCDEIAHPEIARLVVYPSLEKTAWAAAEFIIAVVQKNPKAAITYATGETMVPVYSRLAAAVRKGRADFSKTKAFHLDEYFPCDPHQPHSFVRYLDERVFAPLQIKKENRFPINGLAKNPQAEAARYNALLNRQPIALAILGIGPRSHIGFNERGTPFESETHLAALSEETIARDRRERGQNTPAHAITQGIKNILSSEKILLVAYGQRKGEYLEPALYGPITPQIPASALRLRGEKVHIYIDQAAAQKAFKQKRT